jgi:hypothetical protein
MDIGAMAVNKTAIFLVEVKDRVVVVVPVYAVLVFIIIIIVLL